jgi:hypothetical protein
MVSQDEQHLPSRFKAREQPYYVNDMVRSQFIVCVHYYENSPSTAHGRFFPTAQSPLPLWNQLIELSDPQNLFTIATCSANRNIFIDLHQTHHLEVRNTFVSHTLFTEYRYKILVWNEMDRPVFDVRGL